MTLTDHLQGVYTIMPTPFTGSGELDLGSLDNLVDFQLDAGIHGLAILGFLGEAHKLSGEERRAVIRRTIERVAGRVPVWVGVRAIGTPASIEQATEAQDFGADAVFAAPIDVQADPAIFRHYQQLQAALKVPVLIHDFPENFGITISSEVVARLGKEGGVHYIKMEEPPVGPKTSRILELSEGSVHVFGGLGGTFFLEELERGAVGTMTGFAFPEVLLRIYDLFRQGEQTAAARIFDHYMPLIRYEFQPKLGLALRKHTYHRRGIIASDHVRAPGINIDGRTAQELEAIVKRVGFEFGVSGPQELIG